jgi:hypothetical protein
MPCGLLLCPMLSSRLWQELLEVFQKVWRCPKQSCDLRVDVLYGLRFALVRLQYFQELLVDVGLRSEAVLTSVSNSMCGYRFAFSYLDLVDVADGMIKLYGTPFLSTQAAELCNRSCAVEHLVEDRCSNVHVR